MAFVQTLSKKLGIKAGDYDAWYSVTKGDIIKNGGLGFINALGGSTFAMARVMFSEHEWIPWKFGKTSLGRPKREGQP
jgi:hypothetical protein